MSFLKILNYYKCCETNIYNCYKNRNNYHYYIMNDYYILLQKNEIEKSLGIELDWRRLDNKKASVICTYITGLDFRNQDNYLHLMEQIIDVVLKMRNVFPKYM